MLLPGKSAIPIKETLLMYGKPKLIINHVQSIHVLHMLCAARYANRGRVELCRYNGITYGLEAEA